MFSPFKKETTANTNDVKALRQSILKAVKEILQQWEGGEGGNIRSLALYVAAMPEERQLYEAALYTEEEGRFKNELQKMADDYAVNLPADWAFGLHFSDALPAGAIAAKDLPVGLFVGTGKATADAKKSAKAYIKVLTGEAEKPYYSFASEEGIINVGREKMVRGGDGFYRENKVAFPAESSNPGNKFISRQHAHIEWDATAGVFLLFADEGGVPPRNKVKVKPKAGEAVKLQSAQVGYALAHGDQIMLGDGALLEFGYEE